MNKQLPLRLKAALIVPLAFFSWAQGQDSKPVAVIVNSASSVHNLSVAELRRILLGDRRYWSGSRKIIVLMPPEGSPERGVLLRLLHMNEAEFKKQWLNKQFAGDADGPPISLPASGTALSLVRETQDAIAFIPSSEVRGSVQVPQIDGRSPADDLYPVH
jgi:ABC-type phosphate transport system substrate-binding protein